MVNDKDYRSQWTQDTVNQLVKENYGKNIVLCYTEHDASGLVGSEKRTINCVVPQGDTLGYMAYIFDEGTFVRKGDGYVCGFGALF